jgi:hypothetical protein
MRLFNGAARNIAGVVFITVCKSYNVHWGLCKTIKKIVTPQSLYDNSVHKFFKQHNFHCIISFFKKACYGKHFYETNRMAVLFIDPFTLRRYSIAITFNFFGADY